MAMKKIFVGRYLIPAARQILEASGHEITYWDKGGDPTEDDWIENIKGKHGIYCFGPQRITKRILDAAGDELEIVSAMSVGVDSINLEELRRRGIKLGHTPGVLTDAVADITVSLLLAVSRRILEMADVARNGEWSTWDPFSKLGCGLRESTVGIVGLGRIGIATAKRLAPFGVSQFLYSSRSPKPDAKEVNALHVPFDELLEKSDFVLACCSLNPSTQELFNQSAFNKMKSSAIFINIGRGALVHQEALVEALTKEDGIRGAGLDVTTPEPLPPDHVLFQLKNCVIIPHIGSAEDRTRTDMATLAARNMVAGLKGETMPAQYSL